MTKLKAILLFTLYVSMAAHQGFQFSGFLEFKIFCFSSSSCSLDVSFRVLRLCPSSHLIKLLYLYIKKNFVDRDACNVSDCGDNSYLDFPKDETELQCQHLCVDVDSKCMCKFDLK